MTLIVGVIYEGDVWMGSDSAASADNQQEILALTKHCRKGEFLIGCCGTMRSTQIAQYYLELPTQQDGQSITDYMVKDVGEAVRACFIRHECLEMEGGFAKLDANILLGYRGHLFSIQPS